MPLTEATASTFAPDRAADLLRLLDLEAQWESLRTSPTWHDAAGGTDGLRSRQRAYDLFRAAATAYQARYGADDSAGSPGGVPVRLAGWCRAVAALCRRAGAGDVPTALVERALAAVVRLGDRLGVDAVRPEVPADVRAAAGVFESLAAWCDGLTGATGRRAA